MIVGTALVLFAMIFGVVWGATIVVDPTAPWDANCGADGNACKTLELALENAADGDTIAILEDAVVAVNASLPVKLMNVVFSTQSTSGKVGTVDLQGLEDLVVFRIDASVPADKAPTWKNLAFRNGGLNSVAIALTASGGEVTECTFSMFQGSAIVYSGSVAGESSQEFNLILSQVQFSQVHSAISMPTGGAVLLQSVGMSSCDAGITAASNTRISVQSITHTSSGALVSGDATFSGSVRVTGNNLFLHPVASVFRFLGGSVDMRLADAQFESPSVPNGGGGVIVALKSQVKWVLEKLHFSASTADAVFLDECWGNISVSSSVFEGLREARALYFSADATQFLNASTSHNLFFHSFASVVSAVHLTGPCTLASDSDTWLNNTWVNNGCLSIIGPSSAAVLSRSIFTDNNAAVLSPSIAYVEGLLSLSQISTETLDANTEPGIFCNGGNVLFPGMSSAVYAAYIWCTKTCKFSECATGAGGGRGPGFVVGMLLVAAAGVILLAVLGALIRQWYMKRKKRLEYTDLEGTDEGL